MSVQLEALADDVFDAASAQARMGSESMRLPQGEAIWNPRYPDVFFLNGIHRLVAPDWTVEDFERAINDLMPASRAIRAYSRDPATIATLGRALAAAGYAHEVRLGMVHTYSASPKDEYDIIELADGDAWSDFEHSIRIDGQEHQWSQAMVEQFIDLCHWGAANTPVHYYLAYAGGRAVAHVGLFQHGQTAYLHALYTHPEARRRGAGSALTTAMSEEANAIGCTRLTLQCTDDGYLPRYYGRLGFRPVGEQHIWTRPR